VFREISLPIRRSTVFGALKSRVALWLLLAKYGEVSSKPMRNYGETNQTQPVFSLAVSILSRVRPHVRQNGNANEGTSDWLLGFSPKCRASSASIFAAT
jgi:hypothetical protein